MNLFKAGKHLRKSYKRRIWRKRLLPLFIVLEIILILFFAVPLVLRTPVPFIRIKSDSMLPVLKTGDIVLVERNKASQIGDVIAYYNPIQGRIIVHRVIDRKDNCFLTKGDNTQRIDFFRPCPEQILGKIIFKF